MSYLNNIESIISQSVNKASSQPILADRSKKAKGKHFVKLVIYKNRALGINKQTIAILKGA